MNIQDIALLVSLCILLKNYSLGNFVDLLTFPDRLFKHVFFFFIQDYLTANFSHLKELLHCSRLFIFTLNNRNTRI